MQDKTTDNVKDELYDNRKGEISEGKLKLLKKEHGKVFEIDVDMEEGVSVGYFKAPSLQVFSIVMGVVSMKEDKTVKIENYEQFTNVLVQNCWLDGDEQIKNDEMAAFSVANQLFALIKPRAARIKNV